VLGLLIGKWNSFVDGFIFVGTNKYIQIIFIGFETDEYNFIFVGWVWEPTNIWVILFDLNQPHIFIDDMAYIHQLIDVSAQGCHYGLTYIHQLTDEYRGDFETGCFLFLSSPHTSFHSPAHFTKRATAVPPCSLLMPLPHPLCLRHRATRAPLPPCCTAACPLLHAVPPRPRSRPEPIPLPSRC
jgi:hypothetical protein